MASRRYDIPLLPYIARREEAEVERAARGRTAKTQKVKKIPVRFPSVNNMYPVNRFGGGVRLSAEGRIFKKYVEDCMGEVDSKLSRSQIPTYSMYDVTYVYYMTNDMLFTKAEDLKKTDVSNYLKATEDAVFSYLMEDDCTVTDIHGHKRLAVGDPKLVIILNQGSPQGTVYVRGEAVEPEDLEADGELFQSEV